MARLIINADDLGLSKGVNSGILHGYQKGIVNSSSLMTTALYFEDAVDIIMKNRLENIGLHFNLTEGEPALSNHKTLCTKNNLLQREVHHVKDLDLKEVFNELEAQYLKAIRLGVKINHLDSHHHVHMSAQLRKVFVAISKKYNLPLRRFKNTARHPFKVCSFYRDTIGTSFFTKDFSADFYDNTVNINHFLQILNEYRGNDLEIMCHPGYSDDENGIYNMQREKELNVLCDDEVIKQVIAIQKY